MTGSGGLDAELQILRDVLEAISGDGVANSSNPAFEQTRENASQDGSQATDGEGQPDPFQISEPTTTGQRQDGVQTAADTTNGDGTESGASSAQGDSPAQQDMSTHAQRQARLEANLEAALVQFDERIRQEQAIVLSPGESLDPSASARRSEQIGSPPSGTMRGKAAIPKPPAGSTATGGGAQGHGNGKASRSGANGAPNTNGSGQNTPPDIPGGDDDDVVARQIREAALNEPNPDLREKLWDEYRKYKGIIR